MSAAENIVHRAPTERHWRRLKVVAAVSLAVVLLATGIFVAWVVSLGPLPLARAQQVSLTVFDRNGKLLRAYAMPDGRWRLPVEAKDIDPTYLKLLFAYEDKRFYSHDGVDPLALARAAFQLVTRGHIVSGGSTITMQLARLIEPRRHRSIHAKLRQMVRAIELEHVLNKDQILNLYLTLAPYGGNLEGIRAASIAYFDKEPKRLSLAEAALLVVLPQSPENRRLDRHPEAARMARDRVLDRMVEDGQVSKQEAVVAKTVPVLRMRKPFPILAPHSSDRAVSTIKSTPVISLTLDSNLHKGTPSAGPVLDIGNVPMGTPLPENTVRHRFAFKTGTSYGYREAQAIEARFAGSAALPLTLQRFRPLGEPVRAGNEQAPDVQFLREGAADTVVVRIQ